MLPVWNLIRVNKLVITRENTELPRTITLIFDSQLVFSYIRGYVVSAHGSDYFETVISNL